MRLVDSHVHVVSGDTDRYPLDRVEHPGNAWVDLAPDAEAFGEARRRAGVSRAVLVQPHGAYRHDNRYVVAAARRDSCHAAVAIVAPTTEGAAQVASLAADGVTGLRLFSVPTPARSWLDDAPGRALLDAAGRHGLTASICVLPAELALVSRCAERHPDLPIVVDHCGFAPLDDPADEATAEVLALAATPTVHLKVTTHVIDAWVGAGRPLDELFPWLAGHFGADRLVWGSDYAQTHDRTYDELAALGASALSALGGDAERPADAALRLWFRELSRRPGSTT